MQRDISDQNVVTDVTPLDVSSVSGAVSDITQNIAKAGNEAKITENVSKASLDLNALDNQWRIENQKDPFNQEAVDDYKTQRKQIIDSYGSDVNPLYSRVWQDQSRKLLLDSDAQTQTWQYKQTHENTVDSIQNTMTNYLSLASVAGQNYANGDTSAISGLQNYSANIDQLKQFGYANLGAESTDELIKNYKDQHIKSFISGASLDNPLAASRMMDDPALKTQFTDEKEYVTMKEAIDTRAMNSDKITAQKQVLGVMQDENSILAQSLKTPISYNSLQEQFSQNPGLSAEAKKYFLRANGFSNEDGSRKLPKDQQLQTKADLFTEMTNLTKDPTAQPDQIQGFQAKVYAAMNSGALNENEGANYINQILQPMIQKQDAAFGKVSWLPDGGIPLFGDDHLGLGKVNDYVKDNITVPPTIGDNGKVQKLNPVTNMANTANQVRFKDFYLNSLQAQAASYVDPDHPDGIKMGDIHTLNRSQRNQLYSDAMTEAQKFYMLDKNPSLSTMKDLPNQVFDGTVLHQGMSGTRDIKPDVTAPPVFKTQVGSDGNLYRLYPNGKRENTGPAPKGIKF